MKGQRTNKKIERSRILFIIAFLALPTINLCIFYFGVNFNSILMAFQRSVPGRETVWGFYNFKRLFTEGFTGPVPVIMESLRNTVIFFSFGFFFVNPLTLVMAYFFYKKIRGYKFYRFMFYLPCIIPATVLSTLFRYIIAPDSSGVIATLMYEWFGKEMPNLLQDSRYALKTLLAYGFWTGFGSNLILLSSAMNRIPQEVIESAQLDGITLRKEITHMIIPLIWPTISTILLLAVMSIFTSSGAILLFTQGKYGTYTIAYWLFEQVKDGANMEYASAVGLFFTLAGLPLVFITRWLSNKVEDIEY